MASNDPGKPTKPQDQQPPVPEAAPHDAAAEDAAFAKLMEDALHEQEAASPVPPPLPPVSAEDAAFAELADDAILLEDEPGAPAAPPSSSAVDLGRHGADLPSAPGTPAGEPSYPWEALVEEPATPREPTPPRFDAPSDVEVLRHAAAEIVPEAEPVGEEEETLTIDAAPVPESSRVDLAESGPTEDFLALGASAPAAGDSDVYVAEAAPDSAVEIGSAADVVSLDSDVDLGGASPAGTAEDSSSIELGIAGAALIDSALSGLDLEGAVIVEDASSAVDLGVGSDPVIVDSSSKVMLSSREEVVLPTEDSQSDVFVGADVPPAEAPSFAASGIDLGAAVAPALPAENLSGTSLEPPQAPDEDALATAFPDGGDLVGASSVNLDAPLSGQGSSRDLIAEAVESGVDLARAAASAPEAEDFEAVILSSPAVPAAGDSAVDLGASAPVEEEGAPAGRQVEMPISDSLDMTREWQPKAGRELAGAAEAGAAALEDVFEPAPGLEGTGPSVPVGNRFLQDILGATEEVTEGGQVVTITVDAEAEAARAAAAGVETVMEDGQAVAISVDEEAEADRAAATDSATVDEEAAAEEDERRPAERKYPKPKYARRWVAGTLVGAVLGTAACLAVALFAPETWRQLMGVGRQLTGKEGTEDRSGPAKVAPKPPDLGQLADSGDFTIEPATASAPGTAANDPAALAARGEYRWLQYLQKTPQPKLEDAGVQTALADLKQAADGNDPNGLYWQGDIYETLGKFKEARAIYQKAATQFKDTPALRTIFEGVLQRLELREAEKASIPAATSRLPVRLDMARLVLLLVTLQPPVGQPPMPPKAEQPVAPPTAPEAGFAFWKALLLARQQKYAEAEKALAEAKKDHLARRLDRLRKAQNPRSDPREEIFLRTCDQLTAYFQLQDKLRSGGYLNVTDKKDPVKAVGSALADLKTTKEEKDTLKKDYDKLQDDKKVADDKFVALEKDLDKSKKETKAALAEVADRDTKLKTAAADFKAQGEKLVAATVRGDKLALDKKDLAKTVGAVGDRLKIKNLDPMAGKAVLLARLDEVLDIANTKDPQGRLMANIKEVQRLTATLAQRWTPQTMLGYWSSLLADRQQKALTAAAVRDVERVRADAGATPAAKAEALAVEGLALRNRSEFARARAALEQALKAEAPEKAPWQETARQVLTELTDPAAYYLPRAEALRSERRYEQALTVLDEALKVFPENNGQLLVVRSRTRLDAALQAAKGALKPEAIKEAQEDADAAIKAGAVAAGNFAAGRIAEELGKRDAAADSYRKAIAAAPVASAEAAEYKLALARVLLGAPAEARRVSRLPNAKQLLALLVIGVQPPTPEELALEEANKLADEVLARKDIDKFPLLKAQAQAVKGLWTQALNSYVAGLQPHLSRELMAGLKYIVENHPIQRRPDRLTIPQPMQGEKLYAAALNRYFDRDYAGAEKDLMHAIENFDRDARYHYYLGLARLQQRKRGAAEEFDQAAKLELQGWPARAAVDAALERIQGRPRRLINEARDRVR